MTTRLGTVFARQRRFVNTQEDLLIRFILQEGYNINIINFFEAKYKFILKDYENELSYIYLCKKYKDIIINVIKELNSNKIVIVAGFQGINKENGDITTFGRGGSDTTAVAIAAAIQADKCDIYKDVDGVYNLDPKTNDKAFKYDTISYDEMLNLSNNGAKVLHNKSVELAKRYKVPIHVKSIYNEQSRGTRIY